MKEEKAGKKASGRIRVEPRSLGSQFNEHPFHSSTIVLQILVRTTFLELNKKKEK